MFYTLILLVLFTLFLLIKKPDNKNYIWVIFAITGLSLSIFAFLYYISCLYEYYKIKTAYYDFSDKLWIFMNSLNISAYTVLRILNFGIVAFVFSFLNFSYLYTHSYSDHPKKFISFKYLIFPLFLLVVYDPEVTQNLFQGAMYVKREYFNFSFTMIYHVINWLNKIWIMLYIFIAFYWLYTDYKKHTIQRIRKKILFVILCMIPITGLCLLMFYWFPQQILVLRESVSYRLSTSGHAYFEYSYGNFIHLPLLYKSYPIITIVSITILLYAMYTVKAFSLLEKRQKDQLENSMNTAGLGAKMFSHAIKNDLYAIKMVIEDCEKYGEDYERMGKITKLCNANIERLDRLKNVLNINSVDLVRDDVIECIRQGIDKVGIPEHISLAAEFDNERVETFINSSYFPEVISCILQNAVEAINTIPSKEGLISISLSKRNKEVVISIRDNGCGLNEEKVKRIFDPFYSTKPSSKNWGMGLSYCSRIIQLHNGEIHFKSAINEGSEVSICLPSIDMS